MGALGGTCLGAPGKPNTESSPYLQNSIETSPCSKSYAFFELRRQLFGKMTHYKGQMYCTCCLESIYQHVGMDYSTCCKSKRTKATSPTVSYYWQPTSREADSLQVWVCCLPPFVFIPRVSQDRHEVITVTWGPCHMVSTSSFPAALEDRTLTSIRHSVSIAMSSRTQVVECQPKSNMVNPFSLPDSGVNAGQSNQWRVRR